jgi:hypothetical protein
MPSGKFEETASGLRLFCWTPGWAGNLLALQYTSGELCGTHAERFSMGKVRIWLTALARDGVAETTRP